MNRSSERPSPLSESSAREGIAGYAGRHSASRPLPQSPATPRAIDSSGVWAQGDLRPPHHPPNAPAFGRVPNRERKASQRSSVPTLCLPRGHRGPELLRGAPPPGQLLQRGTGLRGGNTKERARPERAAMRWERLPEPAPRSRRPGLLSARQLPPER